MTATQFATQFATAYNAGMELISIREAGRRLGVSDTTVKKAIDTGRVTRHDEDNDPNNGRPRLRWPDVEQQYRANTDAGRRTHVGSQGGQRRGDDVPHHSQQSEPGQRRAGTDLREGDRGDSVHIDSSSDLNEARRAKEIYLARQARTAWEKERGLLFDSAAVEAAAFNAARAARDELLTMEDRLAPILTSLTDIQEVRAVLREDSRSMCERLAAAKGSNSWAK